MAKLKMGSTPDLAKVHKSGDLKYWPSFWQMVRDKQPFKKGTQGQDGAAVIGYKTAAAHKKFVADMAKCTTSREVIAFLNKYNTEMPTVEGGKVKITELWKDNVKETKASNAAKIGGRDTEVYSEILVQFALAYQLVYNKRATHDVVGDGDDFKTEVYNALKSRIITPGRFAFSNTAVRKNLRAFSRQISDGNDTWLDSASAAAQTLVDKLNIPSDAKIFNDKIFGNGSPGDPYAIYLRANTGLQPDKWNPADIWVMTPAGIRDLVHLNRKTANRKTASVALLNNFLINQFKTKDIIPISLKKTKADPSQVHYTVLNSNEYIERISIGKSKNPTIELTGGNRDMKINFTLETIELNKGMTARRAQANLFGNIGKVKPGSEKHIRIKYNVNKKQLELEYTQTQMPSLALAKMGSLGSKSFTSIISETSKQGIHALDKIKDRHPHLDLTKDDYFISQKVKFTDEQYDQVAAYMDDIWKAVNGDNMPDMRKDKSVGKDINLLKDKMMSSEVSLAIAGIPDDKIKRRVIQNLYNACASVGFGSGLNKEERELLAQSGVGQANKLKAQFTGGLHVKVY
jgi:nitroreductase